MPSKELTAEIEKGFAEADAEVKADVEEMAAQEAVQKAADASVESDEAKAAAEIAENDAAADAEVAANEAAADEAAAEEAAGAEAAAKAATELAPVIISDEALTRAVSAGIPLATARQFPDEVSLNGVADVMERQQDEMVEASKPVVPEEKPEDPFANFPELDPEVHAPEVVEAFERVREIAKQQQETIQELRGRQDETSLASQARVAEEVEQWFDGQVTGLGKDFSEVLGASNFRSLSQGSSQYAKREAIANQLAVLHSGYVAQGLNAPPREQLFDTAARIVLADEYEAIRGKKLSGELEGQASQHLQRAGGRSVASTQSPDEETAAMLDAKYN